MKERIKDERWKEGKEECMKKRSSEGILEKERKGGRKKGSIKE
jgi:hypothetical protein